MEKKSFRTGLAERFGILLVILEIANQALDLFSKVVNYNGRTVQ